MKSHRTAPGVGVTLEKTTARPAAAGAGRVAASGTGRGAVRAAAPPVAGLAGSGRLAAGAALDSGGGALRVDARPPTSVRLRGVAAGQRGDDAAAVRVLREGVHAPLRDGGVARGSARRADAHLACAPGAEEDATRGAAEVADRARLAADQPLLREAELPLRDTEAALADDAARRLDGELRSSGRLPPDRRPQLTRQLNRQQLQGRLRFLTSSARLRCRARRSQHQSQHQSQHPLSRILMYLRMAALAAVAALLCCREPARTAPSTLGCGTRSKSLHRAPLSSGT